MRYPPVVTIADHANAVYTDATGSPPEKCTTAAMTPAPAGIGMPTKYFLPGRPGFEGCGFVVMLKRARRLPPAMRKPKQAIVPRSITLMRMSAEIEAAGSRWKPQIQAS